MYLLLIPLGLIALSNLLFQAFKNYPVAILAHCFPPLLLLATLFGFCSYFGHRSAKKRHIIAIFRDPLNHSQGRLQIEVAREGRITVKLNVYRRAAAWRHFPNMHRVSGPEPWTDLAIGYEQGSATSCRPSHHLPTDEEIDGANR